MRRVGVLLALGLGLLQPLAGVPVCAEGDPVEARAFEVRFRPLADAADVVGALLSDDGRLSYRPRLRTLVVEDRASVLDRVGTLLATYDLPPRNVEITMSLFLGRVRPEAGKAAVDGRGGLSSEVRGVLETLGDVTKWTVYETIGSRSVTGVEGDTVVANLSEQYRVVFVVDAVHEAQGKVKFERLSLQRVERIDGDERISDLYTAGALLTAGQLTVVGAASDPDSERALFLTLQASPR